jgi:hypothetical protein
MPATQKVAGPSLATRHVEMAGWPLDEILFGWNPDELSSFHPANCVSNRDLMEGTIVFGAIGAGKTSGPGRKYLLKMFKNGWGGIVLCAKAEEPELIQAYARKAGREQDLIMFGLDDRWRFNFLNFEAERDPKSGGGMTTNISDLLIQVARAAKEEGGKGSNDEFWTDTLKQLLNHAIEVLINADRAVTLTELEIVLGSAANNLATANSEAWKNSSALYQYLKVGAIRSVELGRKRDYQRAAAYWLAEYPNLSDRTRSIVVTSFTSLVDGFLRGKIHDLFCTDTTVTPKDCQQGKIIVVALPVLTYLKVGTMAQVVWKYLFQKTQQMRSNCTEADRPCFLWADECQYFFAEYDATFQTIARSTKTACVYLTQNISNLYAALGGKSSESLVDSFLGNLAMKIFCNLDDEPTREWGSKLIGQERKFFLSGGSGSSRQPFQVFSSTSENMGFSQQLDYSVRPEEFIRLRTGGPANNFTVDSIVFRRGVRDNNQLWANGKNWIRVNFRQKD